MRDIETGKRREYQFRLRTLLIAILVLSLPLSWFAVRVQRIRKESEVARMVRHADGMVWWQPSPSWLRPLIGDRYFIVEIDCEGMDVSDDILTALAGLKGIQTLNLDDTELNDQRLEHLQGLTSLTELSLANTQVTDSGLVHVAGLTNLGHLNLGGTSVSDTGLTHLKGLTRLKTVLVGNGVTDAGIAEARQALPKCDVWYASPLSQDEVDQGSHAQE